MSPGVDDGSGPLPLENEQQATSSIAGLQGSVAETQEAVRKLQTKKEELQTERKKLSDHIDVLTCCVREKKAFTTDNLGAAVKHFLDVPPSEAVVRTIITKLKDRLHKLEGRLKV